jgi:hypothetical protein
MNGFSSLSRMKTTRLGKPYKSSGPLPTSLVERLQPTLPALLGWSITDMLFEMIKELLPFLVERNIVVSPIAPLCYAPKEVECLLPISVILVVAEQAPEVGNEILGDVIHAEKVLGVHPRRLLELVIDNVE